MIQRYPARPAARPASSENYAGKRQCSKLVAILLCLFAGYLGIHKFYEGKTLMGIVYLITGGLFFIGWVLDLIALLGKPDPYYV